MKTNTQEKSSELSPLQIKSAAAFLSARYEKRILIQQQARFKKKWNAGLALYLELMTKQAEGKSL